MTDGFQLTDAVAAILNHLNVDLKSDTGVYLVPKDPTPDRQSL